MAKSIQCRIDIKPLSVNEAWQGKRFKSPKYKKYEALLLKLIPMNKVPDGKLCLEVTFGFSNVASDADNPVKPLADILQKRYGFNDKQIYKVVLRKEIVKKGNEFIEYTITQLN